MHFDRRSDPFIQTSFSNAPPSSHPDSGSGQCSCCFGDDDDADAGADALALAADAADALQTLITLALAFTDACSSLACSSLLDVVPS